MDDSFLRGDRASPPAHRSEDFLNMPSPMGLDTIAPIMAKTALSAVMPNLPGAAGFVVQQFSESAVVAALKRRNS